MLSDRQTDCQIRVKLGKAHSEHILSAVRPIVLKNSFGGDVRKILEPLVRFTRGDVRDPYRFFQNRPRTFLAALKSYGVAEKSKDQLLRDFWGCSIFDFCNSIRP